MELASAAAGPPVVLATGIGGAGGTAATVAAVAVAAALEGDRDRPAAVLVAELDARSPRGPTMLASVSARDLERTLAAAGLRAGARGALAWLSLPGGEEGLDELERALEHAAAARLAIVVLPARLWNRALERLGWRVAAGLLRCDLPEDRALAALAAIELRHRNLRARIESRGFGPLAARRALAGLDPGGAASRRTRRIARGLLGALPHPAPLEAVEATTDAGR
jgi:hypothetical protein